MPIYVRLTLQQSGRASKMNFKHEIFDHGIIYNGDCLKIMPTMKGKVDMILADLPYGTTACRWDSVIPFEPLWDCYKRLIKDNGAIVLTANQPFTSALVMSNVKWFVNDWVWNKVSGANFCNLKNRPWKTKEDIVVFSKKPNFTFNPIPIMRTTLSLKRDPAGTNRSCKKRGVVEHYGLKMDEYHAIFSSTDGTKHPVDILKFSKYAHTKRYSKFTHATQKPVALFEYLIRTYTDEGDTVLDNVIGSGTTAVACYNTGRRWIGVEKDEIIYREAVERIKWDTAQGLLFAC